jgi:mRNA interferase MazF
MTRGEIWWADLGVPLGSEPGFRRPVLVVQGDSFNRSRISTTVVVAITSNTALAGAPGNVSLRREDSGLSRDSVINVSQIATLDKRRLETRITSVPRSTLESVDTGLALVLGLG